MHGPIVAVKMFVMKHVEVISAAGPHEPVMTQPGPHGTVHDDSQGMDGMEAKADGDEGRGVVEGGLHGMHVCTGEGRGIVGLVVQAVDLPGVKTTNQFQFKTKITAADSVKSGSCPGAVHWQKYFRFYKNMWE